MDLINFVGEIAVSILRHGWNATTLVVFIFALFKFAPFRRLVMRNLPRKLRKLDSDVSDVKSDIRRMEAKIDALMSAGGVQWGADSLNGKNAPKRTTGQTRKSSSQQAESVLATIARRFTRLKATYLSQQRRMNMRSKLLSRKFILAVVSGLLVILNDGLDLGIDSQTVLTFAGIIVSFIVSEAAVDVAKKPQGGSQYDFKNLDAERQAAEDAKSA